jgi:hypothetical protein
MAYQLVIEHDGQFKRHPELILADGVESAKAAALDLLPVYPGAATLTLFRDDVLIAEIDTGV